MAADDDRLFPLGNQQRNVLADDWLPEDGSVQVVADGSVGRFPHLLQVELFHTGLVGGDCGAFYTDLI